MRFLFVLSAAVLFALSEAHAAGAIVTDQVEIPNGEGHQLKAVLYRPEGNGPFPAVVALHGCSGLIDGSGVYARFRDWGQRLVASGFAVIFPDSYGSRGVGNQCRVRKRTVRVDRERVADANAARDWLQRQAFVTADRVSLLGWSNGGASALWTVRPRPKVEGKDFRSAVVFYPGCNRLFNTAWSARVPTLVLIGSADDQTSPAVCQQMVSGARGRSARATIHVYPGAYHDFDHPNRPMQVRNGYAFSVDGSGKIHSGTNAAARADALKRVPEWFAR